MPYYKSSFCPSSPLDATSVAIKTKSYVVRFEVERRHICQTVAHLGNDNLKAARVLGMGKTTLYSKLKEYGFGQVGDLEPEISDADDQLNQLAILKKQAAAVLGKMKQFERRISGRDRCACPHPQQEEKTSSMKSPVCAFCAEQ